MASPISSMSPVIRSQRTRMLASSNSDIDMVLPRLSTPEKELTYVEPTVTILPPPGTPSGYFSSPGSLPRRTGTDFEERFEPLVTILPPSSPSSKYMSTPESLNRSKSSNSDIDMVLPRLSTPEKELTYVEPTVTILPPPGTPSGYFSSPGSLPRRTGTDFEERFEPLVTILPPPSPSSKYMSTPESLNRSKSSNSDIDMVLPRLSTPEKELTYVEPTVTILPPPGTPSGYFSSPGSLPRRTGTDFEERFEPLVTILPPPSPSSKYMSTPESLNRSKSSNSDIDMVLPRLSTPEKELTYVEPTVTILPPPGTPSGYFSSPGSLPRRTGTDFEERFEPIVTILPPPSRSSKYMSPPESLNGRMETDFEEKMEYVQPIVNVESPSHSKYFSSDLTQSTKSMISPHKREIPGRNIKVDITDLAKKMKMCAEQTSSTTDLSSSEMRSIHSMSSMMLSPMRSDHTESSLSHSTLRHLDQISDQMSPILTNRHTRDIFLPSNSFERQSELLQIITRNTSNISRTSSISIETIDLTRERETSEETSLESSPIGYISSTTSLWDVTAKDLSYSIASASDTTGDEDYSVVFERRYQKDIQRKQKLKYEEEHRRIQKQKIRRENFKEFSIKGITWSTFSPEKISFSIKPKNLFPDYFSSKRKYSFSMNYDGKFWTINTFRVPTYELILKLYIKTSITDKNIKHFLEYVVDIIFRSIELEKEFKENRAAAYYAGEDIDLNESDIELLLNEDEKRQYRERCQKLWKGMMSPDLFE